MLNSRQKTVNKQEENQLSGYQIIKKLYTALISEMDSLKETLYEDLSVSEKAKKKAEKISKITLGLQSCLDHEKGEETSENLLSCYRYIRYMAKRVVDHDDMDYVQPAYQVARDLNEAWDGIPENVRN